MKKEANNLELIMLGTGHATVTKCYNTCFLLRKEEEYFLIDAGGGNQILKILKEQEIELTKIHDLFVTHAHSDHILGVVWIIRKIGQLMRQREYDGELRIYGNSVVVEGLKTICGIVLMKKVTDLFGSRIRFIVLEDGNKYKILNEDITFFDIRAKKLPQFGFRIPGKKIIFCGDEPLREELYEYARGVEYMLHEAFCMEAECEKFRPHEKKHSTVKDVCILAEKLGVKNLILVHTEDSHIGEEDWKRRKRQRNSYCEMEAEKDGIENRKSMKCQKNYTCENREEHESIKDRKELYIEEGKRFFSGNILVPDDGERIKV